MSTSWNGQICNGEGKYYIQFETDNKELYRLVEKACQNAMDIAYPREDKPPKYKSICKLCGNFVFHEDITSEGICLDCDKLQHPEDYNDKLSLKEFVKIYCHNCGSSKCEGIGTVWFQDCKYRDRLKGFEF